ncbi:MAG: histidine--tRNA ligase [Candidatus Chisholmbacteria bacterium RIFCSPHIGHO2_01_FULL_48_12]|uniref:Histidine--tRNA ligase n=1 Tax=Candidatus Chisholmbacteria bacterium RIFCSPHIGHO2_01_FULL_48_12 TaxID=1797589 RepID=A0A1G1VQS3_9BACT|nr:MAG: histidine--tRNA ligase [Candidatus Chisholmbacteria bacterium RIFCSPHIGHO2_01_FULL_48_12]
MTKSPLQPLRGFRDFLPAQKRRRDFVIKKVVEVFERFGFEPLQTPMLEYADVILGKYGDEADKLVYSFTDRGGRKVALPYDQTVPTARVLAQYKNQLSLPFRRYQIQSVFRADKPQKGRYREFTQCDIDIFDSSDPLADAEILACTHEAFKNVGYPNIILKLNDRQTLFSTLKPYATAQVPVLSIIQSVDKLDKVDTSVVIQELTTKGISADQAQTALRRIQQANLSANLSNIIQNTVNLGVPQATLQFSPTLARGLDYYTGMIFEVFLPEFPEGSAGGGGRYDNLIKQIGGPDIPAVGIAFGLDRMIEAANALNLFPPQTASAQVLVTVMDTTQTDSLKLATQLRQNQVNTELYPDPTAKLDKQLKYANKKGIPYVAIVGAKEAATNTVTLKNMATGEQKQLKIENLLKIENWKL